MDPVNQETVSGEQGVSKKPRKIRSDKGVKRGPYGPRKPRPDVPISESSTETENDN
jgi:hypothetical protein